MTNHDSVSPGEIETGIAGRACEACHRKKTKCDMQQPVCGLCRRTNKECHFPSTRKRPSRQEPSVRAKLQKVNGNLDRLVELLEANPGIGGDSLKEIIDDSITSNSELTTSKSSPKSSTRKSGSKSHKSSSSNTNVPQTRYSTEASNIASYPTSYELATHLVDVFFDAIQPWLPLLHKPTFLQWTEQILSPEGDALSSLAPNEAFLFNSIFAVAARFSNHAALADLSPKERGERYMKLAENWFKIARDLEEFDLIYFKASTLLAYYHYVSGLPKRGWYITHMCTRGCYELELHRIDEGDDSEHPEDDNAWVAKEGLRRLFWAIWEIDSFGSIIKRKPFAIDWRHIEVMMPVSDEVWFAGRKVESAKFIPGPDCWRTLNGSPNQDERAWTLLAKAFVGYVFDLMLFNHGVTMEQRTVAESTLSCFKLAMPEPLQLTSPAWSTVGLSLASKNWVVAANLYLAAGSFILTRMPIVGQPPSPRDEIYSKELAAYSNRVLELNEILKRWPAEAIPYSHPCIACTILTYDEALVNLLPPSALVSAYRDLSGLILSKIAERWTLGAVLLRVRDLAHDYQNSDEETRAELVKQYPIYFDRELRKNRRMVVEQAQKPWTPSISSPASTPAQYRNSIDQSLSPEQFLQNKQPPTPQPPLQQQPTPPFSYPSTGPMDPIYDPSFNPADNSYNAMQNYNQFPGTGQNPEDIDALFSGFLQEPWWQDFGGVNFVV